MDDLISVPDDLRACLESCLGLDPTQENLEIYLPQIRQIIVILLQGLKDKQTMYKRRIQGRVPNGNGSTAGSISGGGSSGMGNGDQGSPALSQGQGSAQGTPQSVRSTGHFQEERRPSTSSQASMSGSFASHRTGSPDAAAMGSSGLPYLGTERVPQGRSGSTDGNRNRSPLSHPQSTFSPTNVNSTLSLPPLPSGIDRPPSRTSSSPSISTAPSLDHMPGQTAQSGSMSRAALPTRSNLRANHPLPPPPPDAFRPPRSRPPEGGVSPSTSSSSLPGPTGGMSPFGTSGQPPSRSVGLGPSPLPQQAFGDEAKRISPHKVTLTDNGPSPLNSAYTTPPTRSNQVSSNPSQTVTYQPTQQGQYEPMTPPPRGQRRPPEAPPLPPNAVGNHRSPPPHLMNQSRFSLDSDIDTPKSRTTTRDSTANSEHSRGDSSGSHNRRISSFDAGPSLPTIMLPPPPGSPHAIPLSLPTLDAWTGLPMQENPAELASLTALQNSEALGRRASKRYSSYHMRTMLPSHSKGPSSSSLRYNGEIPPLPSPARPQRRVSAAMPPMPAIPGSPATSIGPSTPVRGDTTSVAAGSTPSQLQVSIQSNGDASMAADRVLPPVQEGDSGIPSIAAVAVATPATNVTLLSEEPDSPAPPSASSASGLQVFLQYGRETKKVSLDSQQLSSVADLQGVFMSRFDYSPDGMELFPDVYIKDPVTGIAYHLEEMEDIKPGALLSLNIDPLDQVKQHFDNTITSLSLEIKDLKNNMARNRRLSILQPDLALAERLSPQTKAVERMPTALRMAASSPSATPVAYFSPLPTPSDQKITPVMKSELQTQYLEIQSLRRDLGVMRQTYVDFVTSSKESFQAIREQTQAVREVALSKLKGSRPLVNSGKAALEKQSSDTVEAVDDISDNIDTVKDDVVRRQILPRPGQLAGMREELTKAQKQVAELKQQVTLLMPTCKQTWNQELKNVVDEQKLLQHQQKLAADLEGDISQAAEVFDTLEQYVAQRQLGMGVGKQLKKTYQRAPVDEELATVPNLLMEIRTQEADPNKRLRAIEQQQKARERDKAGKGDEFTNELSGFVNTRKLKKTGGTEEAERIRLRRQDKSFKKMFEGNEGKGAKSAESGGAGSDPSMPKESSNQEAEGSPAKSKDNDAASLKSPV